jgi:hypothetical protein
VRGDSLRDLYAKTLALVGLGLLAGVGALVDHWPAALHVPHVASGLARPAPPRAIPAPNVVRLLPIRPKRPAVPRTVLAPPVAALPNLSAAGEPAMPPAAHTVPAFLPSLAGASVDIRDIPSVAVELAPVAAPSAPVAPTEIVAAEPSAPSATSLGVFAAVFKKTGDSIVKTGVKTGAAIGSALRGVGGALGRVF